MKKTEKKFFIGIDLGWKIKKTTGICVLGSKKTVLLKDVFGKDVLKVINPYLKETKVIAIDAPLTQGRGKGRMRLYEKFLSTKIFREAKITPVPPALMPAFHKFAMEITEKLEEKGFVLDVNLIEVFTTFIKKICKEEFCPKSSLVKVAETSSHLPLRVALRGLATENQKSALICAQLAFLHSQFKTRWLGYKDGFLFLPEISLWRKDWKEKFYRAWKARSRLRYHYLITNLFNQAHEVGADVESYQKKR